MIRIKKHLKNRNLIKFKSYDTIESISKLRNMDVKINKDLLDSFFNQDKLPWPGFFIVQELNNNYKLLSYEVLNNIYFCKISGIEMSVPYNSNFFIFEKLISKQNIKFSILFIFSFLTAYLFSIRIAGILILIQYLISLILFLNITNFNFIRFIKKYFKELIADNRAKK